MIEGSGFGGRRQLPEEALSPRGARLGAMMRIAGVAATAIGAAAFQPTTEENMNGAYEFSVTPGAPQGKGFPTDFKDYPGGVEFFDVYHGPITSTYGKVWWTSTSNKIPEDIVKRFDGKVMAVIGMESIRCARAPAPTARTSRCRSP